MALLDKAAILAAQDVHYEIIPVPEWGGDVRIRSITGRDRADLERWFQKSVEDKSGMNQAELLAFMVSLCCVNQDGSRMFDNSEEVLGKSITAIELIGAAAMKLNAVGTKEVDKLVKPSALAPGADSGSGSPAT